MILGFIPSSKIGAIMSWSNHQNNCICCHASVLPPNVSRRGVLRFAALGATAIALTPRLARAQEAAPYKAMLLSCVDPRTQLPVATWMDQPAAQSHNTSLSGQYSQFTIAGAAVGIAAPAFKAWRETFWDNFGASIQLHAIENLIAVNHSNCGALGIAYGQDVLNDPKRELETHVTVMTTLKHELSVRHPNVNFQGWYVARDDTGTFSEWKNLVQGPAIS
jgi:carbonic anhydrase